MNFLVQAVYDDYEHTLGIWDSVESLCSELYKCELLYDVDPFDKTIEFNYNEYENLKISCYSGSTLLFDYTHELKLGSIVPLEYIIDFREYKSEFNAWLNISELKEALLEFMKPKD
ncbi:hypothetical protein vBSdyM006_222 [Shigella phage vB_SdyM_006]|nr:hypothetical protein vBSdyM006_222 [Shigella phage vB_SdyM_006]QQV89493.1 hypothetical protein SJ_75 [Proteus phage SJ_PmiM]